LQNIILTLADNKPTVARNRIGGRIINNKIGTLVKVNDSTVQYQLSLRKNFKGNTSQEKPK